MQPTKKISQLPQQSAPTVSDKAPIVSGGITDYALLSDLISLFAANVPAGANSQITRATEYNFDFVAGNTGVWTADSVGVNKNASMTALTIYINGRRISISAVSARVFTASKDTYIDALDNLDGTGTLVYTEVSNNAASPALAANSVRIGIIVTGATTIAAVGSINQGQEGRLLPIVSSSPYAKTDSLGNVICPRDPDRNTIGYRQITNYTTSASAVDVDVTGFTAVAVKVPAGREVEISMGGLFYSTASGDPIQVSLYEDGVLVEGITRIANGNSYYDFTQYTFTRTPTSGSHTYKVMVQRPGGAGTVRFGGESATHRSFLKVKLG